MQDDDEAFEDQQDLLRKLKKRQAIAERRTQGIKFVFGSNKPEKVKSGLRGMRHEVVEKEADLAEEDREMNVIMGFSKFGHQKPASAGDSVKEKSDTAASECVTVKSPALQACDIEKLVQLSVETARKVCAKPASDVQEVQSFDSCPVDSEEDDDSFVGPPIPYQLSTEQPSTSSRPDDSDEDDGSSDDEDEGELTDRYSRPPITKDVGLMHGSKNISAIAIDSNGTRVVSGSFDYEVRFWDFERMDHNLNCFRAITPCQSHPINHLAFSDNGERVLVIAGNTQAKILDRDGFVKVTTVKGDQYIRDMFNTKGHTATLNAGCWHPRDQNDFITCSNDGTVRVWNVDDAAKTQKSVIKTRNSGGLRAIPTSVTVSKDGTLLATGCSDGSIQGWDLRRSLFVNTSLSLRDCHQSGSEVSSLSFAFLGNYLLSRATDDTLKLWDVRNTKKMVHSACNLNNRFAMTDCSFSPDDKLVMTGTSTSKGESDGELVFFDTHTFEKKLSIPSSTSVIRSQWHPRLNQIFIGSGDGVVKIFYDEKLSDKGILLCVGKVRKRNKEAFVLSRPQIITPHALPMFKEERRKSRKIQEKKDRADPVKSHKPELPMSGPGAGGRLANSGSTYASYIAKNIATRNKLDDSMDPREAILRHAAEAAANPYWVDVAYQKTQPKPIFQEVQQDTDSDEEEPKKKKVC